MYRYAIPEIWGLAEEFNVLMAEHPLYTNQPNLPTPNLPTSYLPTYLPSELVRSLDLDLLYRQPGFTMFSFPSPFSNVLQRYMVDNMDNNPATHYVLLIHSLRSTDTTHELVLLRMNLNCQSTVLRL